MKALILIAHGSRRAESNKEFVGLVESVRQLLVPEYDFVEASFLECVEPHLEAAIEKAVSRRATSISILPYFLNTGKHVAKDIPDIIERQRDHYHACSIQLLPYIGRFSGMAELIARQIVDPS